MSVIGRVGPTLTDLPNLLNSFIVDLSDYADNLTLVGKTLEQALKEQAHWCGYYGSRQVELNILVKHLENRLKSLRGSLTVQYNENYNPALSERMTDKYIDRDNDVSDANVLLLEVREVQEKYAMVLDAFNRRGFALRDITTARVNSIQSDTL